MADYTISSSKPRACRCRKKSAIADGIGDQPLATFFCGNGLALRIDADNPLKAPKSAAPAFFARF